MKQHELVYNENNKQISGDMTSVTEHQNNCVQCNYNNILELQKQMKCHYNYMHQLKPTGPQMRHCILIIIGVSNYNNLFYSSFGGDTNAIIFLLL